MNVFIKILKRLKIIADLSKDQRVFNELNKIVEDINKELGIRIKEVKKL